MAAYMKSWLLEPYLLVLKKNVMNSLCGKTIQCQVRNFVSTTGVCNRRSYSDSGGSKEVGDKNIQIAVEERRNPHVDQKFINELYKDGKGEEQKIFAQSNLHSVEKENYYKQKWQNKIETITKHRFTRRGTEEPHISAVKDPCPDSFGLLGKHLETETDLLTATDFRDPNERLADEYPDDKDTERDWRKNIPLTRYGRRGRKAFYYTKKITKFGREGKINDAMQVFDDWMMLQDRVMPSKRTFVTLIGLVGRAGYTRKAFQLFRQMKQLGLDAPDQVYTSLFNACANCPMQDYGLKRAGALYQQMQQKGITPNPITVMAAMKAFARCGDFARAFQTLDEIRVPLDVQCFNALLIACAADKESGFRRALKVWQKMRECGIKPAHQTYNLLLRCIRDCGVGDVNTLADDLGLGQGRQDVPIMDFFKPSDSSNLLLHSGENVKGKQRGDRESEEIGRKTEVVPDSSADVILSLQSVQISDPPPYVGDWVGLDENIPDDMFGKDLDEIDLSAMPVFEDRDAIEDVSKSKSFEGPDKNSGLEWWEEFDSSLHLEENEATNLSLWKEDDITCKPAQGTDINAVLTFDKPVNLFELNTKPGRLTLVGGASMLISHMKHHGIDPDITTFTGLLSSMPNDAETEKALMQTMSDMDVSPDIDFLNDVMMRRNMRHESHTVQHILLIVSRLGLTPNMRTYAAVALTCHNVQDAQILLDDMKAANVEPSVEVMGHLLYISRFNFYYKRFLLRTMEDLALKPNHRFIGTIEKSINITKRKIVTAERNHDSSSFFSSQKFQRQFKEFLHFYQSWLLRTDIQHTRHPWERYDDIGSKDKEKQLLEKLS